MNSTKDELMKEIIGFVINASNADQIILSAFIAGMQVKNNSTIELASKERQTT